MLVSLHARHTALYRIFRRLGLRAAGDRVDFHQLDGLWGMECGLRRNDLLNTLSEWAISGQIVQSAGSDGTVVTLTERGSQKLAAPWPLLRGLRLGDFRESMAEAATTAVTLMRARARTRKALRLSSSLVVDRRRDGVY